MFNIDILSHPVDLTKVGPEYFEARRAALVRRERLGVHGQGHGHGHGHRVRDVHMLHYDPSSDRMYSVDPNSKLSYWVQPECPGA
jgi:hypothetical protein